METTHNIIKSAIDMRKASNEDKDKIEKLCRKEIGGYVLHIFRKIDRYLISPVKEVGIDSTDEKLPDIRTNYDGDNCYAAVNVKGIEELREHELENFIKSYQTALTVVQYLNHGIDWDNTPILRF